MSKPTLVLVHGAWHSPAHFEPLAKALTDHNIKSVPVACPTTTNPAPNTPPPTFQDDVSAVRSVVLNELLTSNVLVVAHSYGGTPASEALEALSSSARSAAGESTAVVGIAYICAGIIPKGISFLGALGGVPMPLHDFANAPEGFSVPGDKGPEFYFYNDLPAAEAKHWVSLLRPHSWVAVAESVVTYEACTEIPAHYLYCARDQALVIDVQRAMVKGAEERSGRVVRTEEVDAGHSPFLSRVEETVGFLERCIGE